MHMNHIIVNRLFSGGKNRTAAEQATLRVIPIGSPFSLEPTAHCDPALTAFPAIMAPPTNAAEVRMRLYKEGKYLRYLSATLCARGCVQQTHSVRRQSVQRPAWR
jgi:hypothetical protein